MVYSWYMIQIISQPMTLEELRTHAATMQTQHPQLAYGHWESFSFIEQMANVGSEVERAMKWQQKKSDRLMIAALSRALELLALTAGQYVQSSGRIKELQRLKECLLDYFLGDNIYKSTSAEWHSYFHVFNLAAARKSGR